MSELLIVSTQAQQAREHEFLSFGLGAEEYGIDILSVQEIRVAESCTRIVNAAPHVKGVINLRGVIIPIVDMRVLFGLPTPAADAASVVIVLIIGGRTVGVVVDSVSDVVGLAPEQICAAPALGTTRSADDLIGLATLEERMLILLDIERVMNSAGLGLFERLAA